MALNFNLPAVPFQDALQKAGGLVADIWNRWFQEISKRLANALWVVSGTALTAQGATIAPTVFSEPIPAGLYRVEYYMRVTQAASVSSSATFTVNWTDGAAAQTYSWAAMTGNTTTTAQSAATLVHADSGSQVGYAVTYASSGATPMLFRLDAVLYRVGNL